MVDVDDAVAVEVKVVEEVEVIVEVVGVEAKQG